MKRLLALALLMLALPASAHPLAPALLELRETTPAKYEMLWRTSATRAQRVDVQPLLPEDCRQSVPAPAQLEDRDSLALRSTLNCAPQGLAGSELRIAGLAQASINVIVRVLPLEGAPVQALLDATQPVLVMPAAGAAPDVFAQYLHLGVEHLLGGYDHLLFVAGLVLLVRRARALLLTVTAFTLGHSLTLALAALDWVHVNAALTEVGIALSLLLLAGEAVRPAEERARSWFSRWPWGMAGAFGLLHGLGFAGALSETGLPAHEIPLALFAFNLGIELGQLLVVALLLGLMALARRSRPQLAAAPRLAGYALGTLAGYWCWQRLGEAFI